ncbi:MAG: UvrD-helicase domain-containing protein [Chloroflexi bacterium]|nr:UvrD-helicase domain-containing protein [Chloroflexota bacterium]
MEILANLNPDQRAAVEAIEGPLLILAGPGSGKTRVIVHRIAYLVTTVGIAPYRILAVTFTNKAAKEMRERLHGILGKPAEDMTLGTFHAVCARILRTEAQHAGLNRTFAIYDDDDQISTLKRSIQDVGLDPKQYNPRAMQNAISAAKSELVGPQEYMAQRGKSYFDEVVQRVYQRYQTLLAESQAVDFDDLIMRTVQLFRSKPEVLAKYQNRYIHVLIDEFQDTNIAQYALAQLLAGRYKNICVVGDEDQSVYSWRNADIRNILHFERDFPDVRTILLEQNYRSSKTILNAATAVIAPNTQRKKKQLWTSNGEGVPITIKEAYDDREEAQYVVAEIEELIRRGRAKLKDIAVLYRTNAQSRIIEDTMVRYGMAYKLVGGTRFYERREVKDLLAYLRVIHNPFDSVSLLRIINTPTRGIGQRTVDELSRRAQAQGIPLYAALQQIGEATAAGGKDAALAGRSLTMLTGFITLLNEFIDAAAKENTVELLDQVVASINFRRHLMDSTEEGEERWENVQQLRAVASQYVDRPQDEALTALLEEVALVADVDTLDNEKDSVTLITLHAAKGLEFPVVFLVGLEEGLFPHMRSLDDPKQMEEERRLAYVGITRAKERLFMVRAFRRNMMGQSQANPPSRFLKDVPAELIQWAGGKSSPPPQMSFATGPKPAWSSGGGGFGSSMGGARPVSPPPNPVPTEAPYRAGEKVRHKVFGEGIVISCVPDRSDFKVKVAFKGSFGVKDLMVGFAPLERVTS